MHRRTVLCSLAAGLAATVAGCGGDGDDASPTETTAPEETDTLAETTGEMPTDTTEGMSQTTEKPTTETTEMTTETIKTPTEEPPSEDTTTPAATAQTVEVGADGFNFAPESFTVSVGDTVEWVWVGSNHNVVPDTIPAQSDWSGTPGAPGETYDSGYSYTHSFEVAGEYSYYCNPHRSAGMTGSFTVEE